jgi:hypothetical protein
MSVAAFATLTLTSVKKLKVAPLGVIGAVLCTTIIWKTRSRLKLEQLKAMLDERMEARGACLDCRVEAYRAGAVKGYAQLLEDLEVQRERERGERTDAEYMAMEDGTLEIS